MSFIRKRFSMVWERNSDGIITNSPHSPGGSTGCGPADSDDGAKKPVSIPSRSVPIAHQASPGRLHKAASSTFQSFSESLLAKAQMFYASPGTLETVAAEPPETCEPKTPSKRRHLPINWSPSRRRDSRADLKDKGTTDWTPLSPVDQCLDPLEPAPTLNVKIPSSFLADLPNNYEAKSGFAAVGPEPKVVKRLPCKPTNLWPSPTRIAVRTAPRIDGPISPISPSSLLGDPCTEPSLEVMYDSTLFDSGPALSGASKYFPSEDGNYLLDKNLNESIAANTGSDGFSPATLAAACDYKSPTAETVTSPQSGSSIFVQGDCTHVRFQTTTSPLRRDLQNAETPSASLSSISPKPDSLSETLLCRSAPSRKSSSESVLTVEQSKVRHTPGHESAGLAKSSKSLASMMHHASKPADNSVNSHLPSDKYEADVDSVGTRSSLPNMGSKYDWEKARADRKDRYLAIHTMSETTDSDECSASELELSKSPRKGSVTDSARSDYIRSSEEERQVRLSAPAVDDFQIVMPEPEMNIAQYAVDLTDQSPDQASGHRNRSFSTSPQEIPYAIEAIEKTSGTALDDCGSPCTISTERHSPEELPPYVFEQTGEVVITLAQKNTEDHALILEDTIPQPSSDTVDKEESYLQENVAPHLKGVLVHTTQAALVSSNKPEMDEASEKNFPKIYNRNTSVEYEGLMTGLVPKTPPEKDEASQSYFPDTPSRNTPIGDDGVPIYSFPNMSMGSTPVEDDRTSNCSWPTTPSRTTAVEHMESTSAQSASTTDSCAVTTHSPLCYVPPPFPTLHVRSSPARRTSSIIAGLEKTQFQVHDENTPAQNEGVQFLCLEQNTVDSEALTSKNRIESTMDDLDKKDSTHTLKVDVLDISKPAGLQQRLPLAPGDLQQPWTSTLPLRPKTGISEQAVISPPVEPLTPRRLQLPYSPPLSKILSDKNSEELLNSAMGETQKPRILIETSGNSGNKGKKKRGKKGKKNKSCTNMETQHVELKSALRSSWGNAPDSMNASDINTKPASVRSRKEYQSSSVRKGVWWTRMEDDVEGTESPLAEKGRDDNNNDAKRGEQNSDGALVDEEDVDSLLYRKEVQNRKAMIEALAHFVYECEEEAKEDENEEVEGDENKEVGNG